MTYRDKIFYDTVFPPPPGFKSIMLFGFIFTHSKELGETDLRHEREIHVNQYNDCFLLGLGLSLVLALVFLFLSPGWWLLSFSLIPIFLYYVWYGIDYIWELLKYWNFDKAYKNVIFERQAYKEEDNTEFKYKRFSFLKY